MSKMLDPKRTRESIVQWVLQLKTANGRFGHLYFSERFDTEKERLLSLKDHELREEWRKEIEEKTGQKPDAVMQWRWR